MTRLAPWDPNRPTATSTPDDSGAIVALQDDNASNMDNSIPVPGLAVPTGVMVPTNEKETVSNSTGAVAPPASSLDGSILVTQSSVYSTNETLSDAKRKEDGGPVVNATVASDSHGIVSPVEGGVSVLQDIIPTSLETEAGDAAKGNIQLPDRNPPPAELTVSIATSSELLAERVDSTTVDTAESLGFFPKIRGSLIPTKEELEGGKKKPPSVAKASYHDEIYDKEDRKRIIELLDEDDEDIEPFSYTPHVTTLQQFSSTIDLTNEDGVVVSTVSEEVYWKRKLAAARRKRVEARNLIDKKKYDDMLVRKNAGVLATYAFMLPLEPAEKAVIQEALYSEGENDNVVIQRAGGTLLGAKPFLTRADIQTLRPRIWLAEAVINYYMHCLRERQRERVQKKLPSKICHFFRTALYAKIHPSTFDGEAYTFDQVKNWTKRNVPNNSIFRCQALFFPCNVARNHWILIVAYMEEKTIQVYCSLFGSHRSSIKSVFRYLKDAYRHEYQKDMPSQQLWKLYQNTPHCPRQKNAYDCGVFVCMYADYIANGWPLVFNQSHMNHCRERIALGCMDNCAVSSRASKIMLDEVWKLRYHIILGAQNYKKKFIAFLEKGDLPKNDTMGIYCTDEMDSNFGKVDFVKETMANHRVRLQQKKVLQDKLKEDMSPEWNQVKHDPRLRRHFFRKYLRREEDSLGKTKKKPRVKQSAPKALDQPIKSSVARMPASTIEEGRPASPMEEDPMSDWGPGSLAEPTASRSHSPELDSKPLAVPGKLQATQDDSSCGSSQHYLPKAPVYNLNDRYIGHPDAEQIQIPSPWSKPVGSLKPPPPPADPGPSLGSLKQPPPPVNNGGSDTVAEPTPTKATLKSVPITTDDDDDSVAKLTKLKKRWLAVRTEIQAHHCANVAPGESMEVPPAILNDLNDQYLAERQALEDVSALPAIDDFSQFVGNKKYKVATYFEVMKANEVAKTEHCKASRRNRAKLRVKRTMEEVEAFRHKIRVERTAKKSERKETHRLRKEDLKKSKEKATQEQNLEDQITKFGADHVPLLVRVAGKDQRDAKRAIGELNKLFPAWTYTPEEKASIKIRDKAMSKEDRKFHRQQEDEVKEIVSLKYKSRTSEYVEHFMGMAKQKKQDKAKPISFLNPQWIRYNFHPRFVSMVTAYAEHSNAWVPVPVGCAKFFEDAPPPYDSIVHSVQCHYPQGNKEYCLFYSFASALFHLGFKTNSEMVRMAAHGLEHSDRNSQIKGLREILLTFDCFEREIIWGPKKKKYLQFDIMHEISDDPTLVIPFSGYGGNQHAFTTVGRFIFDSTYERAIHLTKESLDWACNTKTGFQGVSYAIRFPLKVEPKIVYY